MPYVNKLDRQIGDWNLTPVRRRMSIARYGYDFEGCHGKAELIPEIGVYSCTCGKFFEPTDGMGLRGTKTPLSKWAAAMELARKHGRNTSARHVAEQVGVSLPTAYRMLRDIDRLPEFDLTVDRSPHPDDGNGGTTRQRDRVFNKNKLLKIADALEGLNPNLPDLPKDYHAGLMHGLKWAAKVVRREANE